MSHHLQAIVFNILIIVIRWLRKTPKTKNFPEKFLLPDLLPEVHTRVNLKEGTVYKMKEVTPQQFHDRFLPYKNNVYYLRLQGWEVAILHGLISLVADHPNIKAMQGPTNQVIDHVRLWCGGKFGLWGFTPEEVEYLDEIRDGKDGETSSQDNEQQLLDLWTRVKSKVWQLDVLDAQIFDWFKRNYHIDVRLSDFDMIQPPSQVTLESLGHFLKTLERHAEHI
ncbi:hypothetical protein X793_03530 [Dehalococcoides mccartyi CG4]|uniref:hypothetical protein n=1 Tax=Dehalococcoides mccartyi TaxID=61435 RepID=UPI0004E0600F|nr:hypothetical protein [Dehalococcoides mccartyi]AII60183.1 hypothetical protein X793_03530 [Dehalococcoides mccartyi CG4]